jgi:transcriptional regulator with XRE-family HTH domain
MSVVVYSRLAELLKERNLTVAELERQLKERFGLAVNPKTLYRLTQAAPVQRADLEIAGATAAVLGVGLDDLFAVDARPTDDNGEADLRILGPADSRRMAVLVDRQAHGLLSAEEWAELEKLVATYGRLLHERRVREAARKRGQPVEQVRREMEESLAQAMNQWRAIAAAPTQQPALDDHNMALRTQ